jgi:hypothetical protein
MIAVKSTERHHSKPHPVAIRAKRWINAVAMVLNGGPASFAETCLTAVPEIGR